jgi:anti-sigma-K factor RskA
MSELNRYQNPEVFEKLAMAYAAGTLHGRARLRFEKLKSEHFYLEATTNAFESKFGSLVELLPSERPSDQVWKNIESSIQVEKTEEKKEKTNWFSWLTPTYAASAMAVLLAVFLVILPGNKEAVAYAAVLGDAQNSDVAITRITSDLSVSVEMVKKIELEDGTVLKLWCHPKNGGEPMEMGVVSSTGKTTLKISEEEWENMQSIGKLEISAESHSSTPTSKRNVLLKGYLNPITEE